MIKKFNEYINEDLKITGEYDGRAEELNYTEEDLIDAAKNCNNAKAFVRHITYGSTNETDTLSKEDNKKLTDWFNNHKSTNESASQSKNFEKNLLDEIKKIKNIEVDTDDKTSNFPIIVKNTKSGNELFLKIKGDKVFAVVQGYKRDIILDEIDNTAKGIVSLLNSLNNKWFKDNDPYFESKYNESTSQSNNEETFPSSANRIYNILTGRTFEEWYNKDFMDYIEGDDKAKSKKDILADIKNLFK